MRHLRPSLIAIPLILCVSAPLHVVDEAAAKALFKESKCGKCHSVEREKDGPSYREIAKKYKGKSDAESKLTKHVTVSSKVKIEGEEEDHPTVKTRDPAKIKNLVQWILAQ